MSGPRTLQCAGCKRPLGVYETAQMRSAVWCGLTCRSDLPVGENEVRDDALVELSHAGWTDAQLGDLFGFSRVNAQKIINRRGPRPSVRS